MLGIMPDNSFEEFTKMKFIGIAFNLLVLSRILYLKRKVKAFLNGLCPKGAMTCLGGFRRNLITFNATFLWIVWWNCVLLFCCISVDYGRSFLSAKTQFWIWNISETLGCEGAHFIFPFLLQLPSQGSAPLGRVDFYVRDPDMEPRRPPILTGLSPPPHYLSPPYHGLSPPPHGFSPPHHGFSPPSQLGVQGKKGSRFIYVRSK